MIPDIRIKFQDKNLTILSNLEDIFFLGGEEKQCYLLCFQKYKINKAHRAARNSL